MKKLYRPKHLKVKTSHANDFKVVDVENDVQQLATVFEFNSVNSDLPIEETREFVEHLCQNYNKRQMIFDNKEFQDKIFLALRMSDEGRENNEGHMEYNFNHEEGLKNILEVLKQELL